MTDCVRRQGFWTLTIGSIGVVFGDIGTSPLYALREALAHARHGASEAAALGVCSLVIWALILVVTVKYLILVMRADNRGEGGTLALMALAQHALGKPSALILGLGIVGAAMFYADSLITPAISVLSAAEGLTGAPGGEVFGPYVMPIAAVILAGLFAVQARGTAAVGRFSWLRTRWTRPCLPGRAVMPSWLEGTLPSPERSWSPSRDRTW